jgi:FkbM family methyltransferase
MKTFIKNFIRNDLGYDIRRIKLPPNSPDRPMGFVPLFEGVKYRGVECRTFLDGGANTTSVSRTIKKIYPGAKCILIEPNEDLEPYLQKFCNEFKDSKYFLSGLGAKKEVLTFTVSDYIGGSTFMYNRDEELIRTNKQKDVQVISIDDLITSGEIEIPDIIKLDIQGFEIEALKGASKTFGKTELYLLETAMFKFDDSPGMPDFTDVFNFMAERNYVPYEFAAFLRRPYDGALGSCDVAFAKKDGILRKSAKW